MTITSAPEKKSALKFAALGLFVLGLGLAGWVVTSVYTGKAPVAGKAPMAGQALVGGPFTAVDHTGRAVTEADFKGRYSLVYFGYTFCPDVCPGELQVIGATMDLLGKRAEKITPIFFTIDPERDTPEILSDYVPHFHERMVGLTGTSEQMAAAAGAYRVYFAKGERTGGSGGYLMDHSSLIYLMDDEGRYLSHFNYGTPPESIAAAVAKLVP